MGAGPAHAFYFGTYEHTKSLLDKVNVNSQIGYSKALLLDCSSLRLKSKLIFFCCCLLVMSAVTATLIHDAISNPTEVIKQRLQMRNSPYRSVAHCARMVYRTEGMSAFYRSYVTQLCMNVPYQMIHFSTYEFFQNLVSFADFFSLNIASAWYFVKQTPANVIQNPLIFYFLANLTTKLLKSFKD